MFEIEKKFRFEAGHSLGHHDGKCKDPHGHSYVLLVVLRSENLISSGPKKNMLMDFCDLSETVTNMIESHFDHKWLNDTLQTDSPTAEFIAKWIFDYLRPFLPGLHLVTLFETEGARATFIS